MFQAAFCLAFACFLCSGELMWEVSSIPVLTVGSVEFRHDGTFANIFLPSSKEELFGAGVTLTAPSVPHKTCTVKVLQVICQGCSSPAPLFALNDGLLFAQSVFLDTLSCCLTACSISPWGYSGHSFQRRESMALMMLPSKGLDTGAATASGNTLTSQWLIVPQPQPQLSTKIWTNLLTSPLQPGAISDLVTSPSPVGSTLASLEPQLATVSPCGMLLAL
ncbi:uncharacterized protein UBRO_20323 [Ustilago bromivora]|uniref:Uncharacterized protein n=1 Tax=Ustilago bromivora TaxID=307758 RepID=A0A1K0G8W1_9BASI|nr:uncharacterized protein UBRO_20323 [Ustilago bromivora]